MAGNISWKHVFAEARKVFFLNRTPNDMEASLAFISFSQDALKDGVTPELALRILKDDQYRTSLLGNAETTINDKFNHSIEQAKTLKGLEASTARIEAGVAALQTASSDLHATAKDITAHTLDIKTATNTGLGIAKQNADTAQVLQTQVGQLETHASKAHEKLEKILSGTRLKVAIAAGCASGLVISILPGFPLNVLGNYYYERYWSKDALGQAKPQAIVLELKTNGAGNCLPSDTLQKLQSGQSVTLPTGSGTVCLILPQQQPQQPPPPRQEVPVAVQPLPAKPVVQTPKLPHHGTHHIRKLHGCHH